MEKITSIVYAPHPTIKGKKYVYFILAQSPINQGIIPNIKQFYENIQFTLMQKIP